MASPSTNSASHTWEEFELKQGLWSAKQQKRRRLRQAERTQSGGYSPSTVAKKYARDSIISDYAKEVEVIERESLDLQRRQQEEEEERKKQRLAAKRKRRPSLKDIGGGESEKEGLIRLLLVAALLGYGCYRFVQSSDSGKIAFDCVLDALRKICGVTGICEGPTAETETVVGEEEGYFDFVWSYFNGDSSSEGSGTNL